MKNKKLNRILIVSLSIIILFMDTTVFAQSPAFAVLPSTIDFGPVYKNEMQWERLYVESYWAYTLTVQSVKISGDEDFMIKSGDDSCSGNDFNYEQRCPIRVTFVPTAQGPRQAVLSVQTNGGTNFVKLKGVGVIRPASR
jgi:hypothetical protein